MWFFHNLTFVVARAISYRWARLKWHWRDLTESEESRSRREDEENGDPVQW